MACKKTKISNIRGHVSRDTCDFTAALFSSYTILSKSKYIYINIANIVLFLFKILNKCSNRKKNTDNNETNLHQAFIFFANKNPIFTHIHTTGLSIIVYRQTLCNWKKQRQ